MTVNRLHSFQQPKFHLCHILSLQRCGVDGHKPFQFFGIPLRIRLPHIASHRLPHDDGSCDPLLLQNSVQPHSLVHQIEVKGKRPGSGVSGGVPHKDIVFPLKIHDLFVKQPVIRRQTGQEHQRYPVR